MVTPALLIPDEWRVNTQVTKRKSLTREVLEDRTPRFSLPKNTAYLLVYTSVSPTFS
jgi:hypothetical protein